MERERKQDIVQILPDSAIPETEVPVLFRTGKDDESAREVLDRLKPDGVVSRAEGRAVFVKTVEEML